jgi:serine/threonine protein kinase
MYNVGEDCMNYSSNIRIPWPGWTPVRRIGRGGYGSVWEIERDVEGFTEKSALKVISVPFDASADSYAMGYDEGTLSRSYGDQAREFVREYQLVQAIGNHPNVVACQDISITRQPSGPGWDVYIRMELLTPLVKWIDGRKLSWREVARLGHDIATALVACEVRGIVHRDIKPANIMVNEWGNFKLGDFGVARTMEGTHTATVAGTATYMAPEVVKREKYGRTVDIYSLGLVMYWALNEYRLPFMTKGKLSPGDYSHAERRRLTGERIPVPPGCPPNMGRIVLRCCAYSAADRYQSARDLLDDLDLLLSGGGDPQVTEKNDVPSQEPAAPTAPFVFSPASGEVNKGNDFFKGAVDEPLWEGYWISNEFVKLCILRTDTLYSKYLASPVSGTVTMVDTKEDPRLFEIQNDLVKTSVLAYIYQDSATVVSEVHVKEGDQVRAGDRLMDVPSPLTQLGSVWLDASFTKENTVSALIPVVSEDAQLKVGQPVLRVTEKNPSSSSKQKPSSSPKPQQKEASGNPTVSGEKPCGEVPAVKRAHAQYVQSGTDVRTSLYVVPSDRGEKVSFEGPNGRTVRLAVPANARDGMTLRVRGLGARDASDSPGSLYVRLTFSGRGDGQPAPANNANMRGENGAANNAQADDVNWGEEGYATIGRGFGRARSSSSWPDEEAGKTVGAG